MDVPNREMQKISIRLQEAEWYGRKTETIWAKKISDNKYIVENSPFYAKGISFEDVIIVSSHGTEMFYQSTAIFSGHSTYRIIPVDGTTEDLFQKYWQPLQNIGCTFESADLGFQIYSVNVPSQTDINKAYKLLQAGEDSGIWGFEEGHCGHNV